MHVIACMKHTVDLQQIRIKRETREPVLEGLPLVFGDMDKNALEEAVRIKEKHAAKVTVLSVGSAKLKEGMVVVILMVEERPIDITLPITVDLKVVKTEIATKTATITPQMKQTVLETGYVIGTPSFIKEGDIIKVDTRSGGYVERVSK